MIQTPIMKAKILFYCLAAGALLAACAKPCSIVWTEGETSSETRLAANTLVIQNPPKGTDWTIWFTQFRTPAEMAEGAPAHLEHINGTLYRVVPDVDTKGNTMTLAYGARPLVNRSRAPEAFYLQVKGKEPVKLECTYEFLPADPVVSFTYTPVATAVQDMIPRLKKVVPGEGSTALPATDPAAVTVGGQVPGWYRIRIDGKVSVEAADADGAWYAGVTLANLRRNAGGSPVRNMTIEDWPDMPYRAIMLDVSRNFTTKDNILKLLDLMAHYKASALHLHIGDDEGWRLEIAGLPELTSYGSRRGIPVLNGDGTVSEPDCLAPAFGDQLGSGYYSKADYIEILRYAADRHIAVIPEFDMPGHSRAAIKSMAKRAAATGENCLLTDPDDTSVYNSAQDFNDCALDVSLPAVYTFIGKVFDATIAIYQEAGVPLPAIHVGGDEVPEGAWTGSPSCRKLMAEQGMTDVEQLKDYFVSHVLDIAEARGVKLAGWQELAQHLAPATLARLQKNLYFVNMWRNSRGVDELPYRFANEGTNVVLSSSSNLYYDLAYNYGKLERGHSWAGFVDERRGFSYLPFSIYKSVRWDDRCRMTDISKAGVGKTALEPGAASHIIGVSGQLWGETLRSFDHVTYYLFPKAAPLFERAWNSRPSWEGTTASDDPAFMEDFNRFFSIIVDHEYPYYEAEGISYHRHVNE